MSTWLTIPSARPTEEIQSRLASWLERGYRIALWRDDGEIEMPIVDVTITGDYPGYARACNALIAAIMKLDVNAEWFVTGGDDIEPDMAHSAEEIARECCELLDSNWVRNIPTGKFYVDDKEIAKEAIAALPDGTLLRSGFIQLATHEQRRTFGVMQPTGDRWQEGMGGFSSAPIDRVAGSPWIGRAFAERVYGGNGPYWPEYTHMFVDEELQAVAEKLGVFWQRRDLVHLHRHALRHEDPKKLVDAGELPRKAPHLVKWNTQEHWGAMKRIFEQRKAAGFPGHEPI